MEVVVKVDDKGRILIPKKMRDRAGIRERGFARVYLEGNRIIIERADSLADRYYGIIKVRKRPDDLDRFLVEAARKWWSEST